MFDVDKISKAISQKNPRAKIIFGISKNPKYKNKIKTTLLMTGPDPFAELQAEKKEEKIIEEKSKSAKKVVAKNKEKKKKIQKLKEKLH